MNNAKQQVKNKDKEALIEFKNVCFSWAYKDRDNPLLKDISFLITKHECIGIQGNTGAGKSTLVQLIAGLVSPNTGIVYIKGKEHSYDSYRRSMHLQYQMLYQQPLLSFNPRLPIYRSMYDAFNAYAKSYAKNIVYTLKYNSTDHVSKPTKKFLQQSFEKSLLDMLNKVEIPIELLYRYPHQVSGGELQRLSLARVFLVNPKLIILDEPVSFLDIMLRRQILDTLMCLFHFYKSSVILISHLEEVLHYTCSTVYTLKNRVLH